MYNIHITSEEVHTHTHTHTHTQTHTHTHTHRDLASLRNSLLAYGAGEHEEEPGNARQSRDAGQARECQEARQVFEDFSPALGTGAEHGTHVHGMAAAEGNAVGKEDEDDVDEETGDGEEEVMFLWGCMSCDDVMRVHVVI
jgi:hypothetical protein